MEFDQVDSVKSMLDMIKNDTLIEDLDQDQSSECLKHTILNIDDSLFILEQIQSKYEVLDRFKAVRHIFTDFGDVNKLDCKKFVEFIKSLGRCLHLKILDSIAVIIESVFSKIYQFSSEIKQNLQKTVTKRDVRIQTQQTSTSQTVNKNIDELKKIPKTDENFDKIYMIYQRIAAEKDKDAISFAFKEKIFYVTQKYGNRNIFTKAVYDNNQDLVRLLIGYGIDINNTRDKFNETGLIAASCYGRYEIVKLLLTVPGIDVNAKDENNWTALIWASRYGYHEVVKLLLAVPGIDINAKDYRNNTALICASKQGHHEVVKLLLTVPGINVNAKNNYNWTALICASENDHHKIVKMLKAHGAA